MSSVEQFFEEEDGVDFFTADLIRRTRGRREKLAKENMTDPLVQQQLAKEEERFEPVSKKPTKTSLKQRLSNLNSYSSSSDFSISPTKQPSTTPKNKDEPKKAKEQPAAPTVVNYSVKSSMTNGPNTRRSTTSLKKSESTTNTGGKKKTSPVAKKTETVTKPQPAPTKIEKPAAQAEVCAETLPVRAKALMFEKAMQAEEKPAACPERLPVRAKASIFEKAIQEETLRAAQVKNRDKFLQQRKAGDLYYQEPPLEAVKKSLSKSNENLKRKFDSRTRIKDIIEDQIQQYNKEQEELQKPSPPSTSNDAEMHDASNEAVEEEDMNDPLEQKEQNSTESYYAQPAQTLNSLSGSSAALSDHSVTISTVASSGSSSRMYPDLPSIDHAEIMHSSPQKQSTQPMNLSPVKQGIPKQDQVPTPMRTLSAYRLQQKQRAQIVEEIKPSLVYGKRRDNIEEVLNEQQRKEMMRRQIQELKQKATVQDNLILQASKAINLCLATAEGSQSHVDAEKTLLVSMRRRAAILNEAHKMQEQIRKRIKTESVIGCLTINRIIVPISSDIVLSYAKGQGVYGSKNHYFFCLLSSGTDVAATTTLELGQALSSGFLQFDLSTPFTAKELQNDFIVQVEVYNITMPKESKKDKAALKKKAKAAKAAATTLISDDSIRNPNFKLFGAIQLNQKNCHQKGFALQNFMTGSALAGSINFELSLRANYNTKFKGFLNFFEEREGGVWVRRWSVLDGCRLIFWRFQEDEGRKNPMGVIDLRSCINQEIGPLSYDVCARKYSFMILTANSKDQFVRFQYLMHRSYKTMMATRFIIAADVREERDEWLELLNKVISSVRMWEETALQPCTEADLKKFLK